MHGIPTMAAAGAAASAQSGTRSSVGGGNGTSWWCAPFGANSGAPGGGVSVQEPDYVPPSTRQQIPQWSAPLPKASSSEIIKKSH